MGTFQLSRNVKNLLDYSRETVFTHETYLIFDE